MHGGGFYHSQKYKVAPPKLPEHLHWFKWEAYTTWLSGFALLVVLYWLEAGDAPRRSRRRRPERAAGGRRSPPAGSCWPGSLYDGACRFLRTDRLVAVAVAVLVTLSAYVAGELFAARASFLQVGAMLGTIMAANVFFVIIPAHWELVRAKQEGREPDPAPGLRAKQRSVHNNYLTLPVVFTMLAGHFPLAFGQDRAWLVLLAIFAARRSRSGTSSISGTPDGGRGGSSGAAPAALSCWRSCSRPTTRPRPRFPTTAVAQGIVTERCQTCHSGVSAPARGATREPRRRWSSTPARSR